MRLENFLAEFYETLSFEADGAFKKLKLVSLFSRGAIVHELNNGKVISKTIEQFCEEFEKIIIEYPELFHNGFQEYQTSVQYIKQDFIYMVQSSFEKQYKRNSEHICEQGVNHMVIQSIEGSWKILSIYW